MKGKRRGRGQCLLRPPRVRMPHSLPQRRGVDHFHKVELTRDRSHMSQTIARLMALTTVVLLCATQARGADGNGVVVLSVGQRMQAEQAGLRAGDLLQRWSRDSASGIIDS